MIKKKILIITDVNSPYRDHLFSLLNEKLKKKNIKLKIYFMKSELKIRKWNSSLFKNKYEFMISKSSINFCA